jgi:hypothetical protein
MSIFGYIVVALAAGAAVLTTWYFLPRLIVKDQGPHTFSRQDKIRASLLQFMTVIGVLIGAMFTLYQFQTSQTTQGLQFARSEKLPGRRNFARELCRLTKPVVLRAVFDGLLHESGHRSALVNHDTGLSCSGNSAVRSGGLFRIRNTKVGAYLHLACE